MSGSCRSPENGEALPSITADAAIARARRREAAYTAVIDGPRQALWEARHTRGINPKDLASLERAYWRAYERARQAAKEAA
jgi:hypothetical protein